MYASCAYANTSSSHALPPDLCTPTVIVDQESQSCWPALGFNSTHSLFYSRPVPDILPSLVLHVCAQVIVPVRALIRNLRPVLEPSTNDDSHDAISKDYCTRNDVSKDADKEKLLDHDDDPVTNHDDNVESNVSGNNTRDDQARNEWRCLCGEVSGLFPLVDRSGKQIPPSEIRDAHLNLRLCLSIRLELRQVRKWDDHVSPTIVAVTKEAR